MSQLDPRNTRRQHLFLKLFSCGHRPLFELLLEIESGASIDEALERFTRVPAQMYRAVGADALPIEKQLMAIDGGRA